MYIAKPKLLLLAISALMVGSLSLSAAEVGLDGKALLKASLDYSGGLSKVAFSGKITNYFDGNKTEGIKTHIHTVDVLINRPNKLRISVKGDSQHRKYLINDGNFSVIDAPLFVYGEAKVPKDIDGALEYIFKELNMNPPMGSLLYSKDHARAKTKSITFLGEGVVDSVPCNKVEVVLKNKTIRVWISKDAKKPLVMKYNIYQENVPAHTAKEVHTVITWKDVPKLTGDEFTFVPPKDCHRIPFLGDKK